jgi:DNA-binding NarL/FixJ family response regulator
MIRIFIISPIFALRPGLRSIIESYDDLEVIGEGENTEELKKAGNLDVILFAADGNMDELEAELDLAKDPPPAILILSEKVENSNTLNDLPLRAWGMLPPESSEEELHAAIVALHEGLMVGSPILMEQQFSAVGTLRLEENEALIEELTEREVDVLGRIAQGLANKQIALELNISEHTVKFHSSAIYSKLNVSSRTEAVRRGVRLGLIAF